MLRSDRLLYRQLYKSNHSFLAAQLSIKANPDKAANNENRFTEEEIAKIRNCSRLNSEDYRIENLLPAEVYPADNVPHKTTLLKYRRADIGRNGFTSQYDPATCFLTKEEMEDLEEYEKVAFNVHILDIRKNELEKIAQQKKERKEREELVMKKYSEVKHWKQKIADKIKEKEKVAEKAKAEKAKLLEEVRRFFGYSIDFKDEKFQLMLEHKERELQKQKKLEKKQKKDEMFLAKLAELESSIKSVNKGDTKDSKSSASKKKEES